jgi:hypothetical protein
MIDLKNMKLKTETSTFKIGKKEYPVYDARLSDFNTKELNRVASVTNAKLLADCIMVSHSDIVSHGREMQSRAMDTDKNKVKKYVKDIAKRGLLELPTVTIKDNKIVLLGGHHRLQALFNLHYSKPTEEELLVPVRVYEFNDDFDRLNFLQENNDHHEEGMNQNKQDNVMYVQQALEMVSPNLSKDQARMKIISGLERQGLSKKKAESTFEKATQVKTAKVVGIKSVTSSEYKKAIKDTWGAEMVGHRQELKADSSGNFYVRATAPRDVQRVLGNCRESFYKGLKAGGSKTFKIHMAAHVLATAQNKMTPQSIRDARKRVLANLADDNINFYIPSGKGHIEEVMLMGQICDGKDQYQDVVYKWNGKEFV